MRPKLSNATASRSSGSADPATDQADKPATPPSTKRPASAPLAGYGSPAARRRLASSEPSEHHRDLPQSFAQTIGSLDPHLPELPVEIHADIGRFLPDRDLVALASIGRPTRSYLRDPLQKRQALLHKSNRLETLPEPARPGEFKAIIEGSYPSAVLLCTLADRLHQLPVEHRQEAFDTLLEKTDDAGVLCRLVVATLTLPNDKQFGAFMAMVAKTDNPEVLVGLTNYFRFLTNAERTALLNALLIERAIRWSCKGWRKKTAMHRARRGKRSFMPF